MASPREILIHTVPSLYKAAEVGDIKAFNEHRSNLNLLLTPNKNTLLHIHIIAQSDTIPESTDFVENILHLCPSLLLHPNTKGETSLHLAARYGRSRTVKLLFERAKALHEREAKQLLTMTNNLKDTALHEAVRFNHLEVVKLLIKEDPCFSYSANVAGETPLYLVAERGFGLVVWEILRTCTSPSHAGPGTLTALHASVIRNDHGITKEIQEVKGADLTKEADEQGWTPLHYAAYLGYVKIVELLLNVDISAAYLAADGDSNKTALHIAVDRTHFHTVEMLVSRCPACWELVDKRGWNLFHFAAKSNYLLSKLFLLSLESPSLKKLLNEKDEDGNTPLHLSVAYKTDFTDLIKVATVDKMAFNNKNLNALDILFTNKEGWDSRLRVSRGRPLKKIEFEGEKDYEKQATNRKQESMQLEEKIVKTLASWEAKFEKETMKSYIKTGLGSEKRHLKHTQQLHSFFLVSKREGIFGSSTAANLPSSAVGCFLSVRGPQNSDTTGSRFEISSTEGSKGS